MDYTLSELMLFLVVYSFLGWVVEVLWTSVTSGHFCNRGFLNGPWCLTYGFAVNVMIIVLDTLKGRYVLQYMFCVIAASIFAYVAGVMTEKLTAHKLWDYEPGFIFAGGRKGIGFSLGLGAVAMVVVLVLHPAIYFAISAMPDVVCRWTALGFAIIIGIDVAVVMLTIKSHEHAQKAKLVKNLEAKKTSLGEKMFAFVENRLKQAYPGLELKSDTREKQYVFAKGICFDKLFWIFVIWAFLGDIIETIYVGTTAGIWMSRSSLIYGTFSIVWGLGTMLATVCLHKLIGKEDRYIFVGGFFLGGAYEYLCSVFTEVFLGTTFWDYSDMPFNIGGRTNLLFMLFWGIIAIVWLKFLYPTCSRLIEKVPVIVGKILTWIVLVFFVCDAIISVAAMTRYVARQEGIEPKNRIETFVDYHYTDELVEFVWPNMRIK